MKFRFLIRVSSSILHYLWSLDSSYTSSVSSLLFASPFQRSPVKVSLLCLIGKLSDLNWHSNWWVVCFFIYSLNKDEVVQTQRLSHGLSFDDWRQTTSFYLGWSFSSLSSFLHSIFSSLTCPFITCTHLNRKPFMLNPLVSEHKITSNRPVFTHLCSLQTYEAWFDSLIKKICLNT